MLRDNHKQYESAHERWRERYAVGGDTTADRPRRRGIGVQRLRASAALVIEWLTICHRQGWLGGSVLNEREEFVRGPKEIDKATRSILSLRKALGLNLADADKMPAHQAAVAAVFGNAPSGMGALTAYGGEQAVLNE